ncbi:16S rRNA (guanine(966)-N(2))-methyltransferase RsmD [Planctomonas psychrotolerans]|uniref:16S rRNA (guanine(966)-N(2))-methyltransferase RsmD n=1 Tax=Planctomonas psychrotolerans TaxID=2528712 RepID=UPI00123A124A|nr:16S rRNA (guanine(966)-N(2))-methyltransferase RsmD [Planctomonas psychrotolerans]
MTRIIAGFAGSLPLRVPRSGTRPTSDRVREAIFSALEARDALVGAEVLDLYAGSGALGLEAASRGAASVTLVDRSPHAATACRSNAAVVTRAAPAARRPRVTVTSAPVQAFLGGAVGGFDVVFLDPPYDLGEMELLHNLEALGRLMSPGGIVLVERGVRSPEPSWPDTLTLDRRKDYGDTSLWWASAASPPDASSS